jgi:hypothetical protein
MRPDPLHDVGDSRLSKPVVGRRSPLGIWDDEERHLIIGREPRKSRLFVIGKDSVTAELQEVTDGLGLQKTIDCRMVSLKVG